MLLDVLPLDLQLHLCVPSPHPHPYDELRQSILNFCGAAYRPLPEVDHTVRDSSRPAPSQPAPGASLPVLVSRHQASLHSSCHDAVSSTNRCASAQSPASGFHQGSLLCKCTHPALVKGISTKIIPTTSSPFSPPTMARDSGVIADPSPAFVPHAIGSVSTNVAPVTQPSTNPPPNRSAERVSK